MELLKSVLTWCPRSVQADPSERWSDSSWWQLPPNVQQHSLPHGGPRQPKIKDRTTKNEMNKGMWYKDSAIFILQRIPLLFILTFAYGTTSSEARLHRVSNLIDSIIFVWSKDSVSATKAGKVFLKVRKASISPPVQISSKAKAGLKSAASFSYEWSRTRSEDRSRVEGGNGGWNEHEEGIFVVTCWIALDPMRSSRSENARGFSQDRKVAVRATCFTLAMSSVVITSKVWTYFTRNCVSSVLAPTTCDEDEDDHKNAKVLVSEGGETETVRLTIVCLF